MSAARIASAFLVFSGFLIYGRLSVARKRKTAKENEQLLADIGQLKRRMESFIQPLDTIIIAVAVTSGLASFWERLAHSLDEGRSPSEAFYEARPYLSSAAAADTLEELFSTLGSTDLEGELQKLRFAESRLAEICGASNKELVSGTKLMNSLSILMGLAAALLLL